MTKSKTVLALIAVLVVTALLLAGCGKTTAPTTAPPTTTRPPATTVAPTTAPPTTAPPTTAPPTTTRPVATTALPAVTAPPATTTAPAPTTPSDMVTLTKLDGTMMQKTLRKPKYGGTLTYARSAPLTLDDSKSTNGSSGASTLDLTNDHLGQYDWSLGPGGTGERSWFWSTTISPDEMARPKAGSLAEKIQFVDPNTALITIRKGVRFALNPNSPAAVLVNGREATADDVAFTIRRVWAVPGVGGAGWYPGHIILDETKAIDRYTVQVKWKAGQMPVSWNMLTTAVVGVWPREAVEKFGDFTDWKNSVGTGPFILTDYVKANYADFVRNTNYWQKDPIFPENQLPYVDSVRQLYITDASTREAALRTAKIDMLGGTSYPISIDGYKSLVKTTPELVAIERPGAPQVVYMRVDKPDLPWVDRRVRYALSMAIDRQAIVSEFYGGKARIIDYPVYDLPEYSDMYTPYSSLPANVRELYEYHPDRSKQFLAEAGYPNGFQAEVMVSAAGEIDLLQIVQGYWAKIGVDLKLDVKEPATFSSTGTRKTYTQMILAGIPLAIPHQMPAVAVGGYSNYSMVNDPKVEETFAQMKTAWPDLPQAGKLLKPLIPYMYEQVWWVALPAPSQFVLKWPWMVNYMGEHGGGMTRSDYGAKYLWVDTDMKKKMGK